MFDFPSSPAVDTVYSSGGVSYRWDGQAWIGGPVATGDASIVVSDTAPASPAPNSFWYQSNTGNLYLRYVDVDSAQWVQVNHTTDPMANIQRPTAFAHRSGGGNVALGTAVFTKIPLPSMQAPNIGGWTVSGGSLVVPKTGIYLVGGSTLHVSPAAPCGMLCGISINGGAVVASGRLPYSGAAATNATMNAQRWFSLTAGNTIELNGYCSAAGGAVMDSSGETYLWATMLSV